LNWVELAQSRMQWRVWHYCVAVSDSGTRELISWYVNDGREIGI
jgi:hypothetical protein